MARPSEYKAAYAEGARKLALLGATDAEIADFYEVDVRTIYRWKNTHDEFCQALKAGKEQADARVERALYHRAIGYEQEEVKIFMPAGAEAPVYAPFTAKVAPDTTAAIFWLKNRQPDQWRDVTRAELTGKNGGPIETADQGAAKLAAYLDAISSRAAGQPTE
jgi:hypothetical protein